MLSVDNPCDRQAETLMAWLEFRANGELAQAARVQPALMDHFEACGKCRDEFGRAFALADAWISEGIAMEDGDAKR